MGMKKSMGDRVATMFDKPKGDHKRKAVAIAPATVTVRDGEITVVVPDVLGKNESHKNGNGGRRFTSEQTEAYRDSVLAGAGEVLISEWDKTGHLAGTGAWRLEVIGVWPRKRDRVDGRPADFVMSLGDADAAIPQALDALQHAGILDDDARVVEVRAWNLYRRGVRTTIMRLVRVDIMEMASAMGGTMKGTQCLRDRDTAIAHLLPLVPPAVEPPKPAKSRRKVKSS